MPPSGLTDADRKAAWRSLVPVWMIERLDVRLGTADVAKVLKTQGQVLGTVSGCEDGPYSEWSRWVDRCPRGAHVRVYRGGSRDGDLVREGYVAWNELANRTTCAALRLKYGEERVEDGEIVPTGQLALFA